MIPSVQLDAPGGRHVDLSEYHRLCKVRNRKSLLVFCPECGWRATPYDPADLNKPRAFRHCPGDNRPWCQWSDQASDLGPSPASQASEAAGRVLRDKFFAGDNLATAFSFCCVRSWGALDTAQFHGLVRAANRKRLWQAANIPLWAIPFHLLREHRFQYNEISYYFDFRHHAAPLHQATDTTTLWSKPHDWVLVRMFLDSAKPTRGDDNYQPLSECTLLQQARRARPICLKSSEALRIGLVE